MKPRYGRSAGLVVVGALLYVLTFLALYPRTTAIVDEDAYLTGAFLFRTGRLSYEGSSVPAPHMTVETGGRLASKYPPGTSLFLLPFTLLGWRLVFVSGMLLALAGTTFMVLIMKRLDPEIDPAWALLYLFYPAVVILSRTVMSDLLAATLVLAAFYCLLRRGRWLIGSGFLLGLACLVRYSNAVFAPVFLILALRPDGPRLRLALMLMAGFAPLAGLIAAYNAYAYGSPISFPMYLTGTFSPAFFLHNARYYGTALLILYPLMLAAPLVAGKGRRLLLGLPAYTLLGVYCLFSFTYDAPELPARLTLGLRYLLPGLPFFIMGFILAADRLLGRLRAGWLKYAAVTCMALLSIAIQLRHDRYLRVQAGYQRLLLDNVPASALLLCDAGVSELVSYAWGWRDYRRFVEFNVPIPLDSVLAGDRPLYAGLAVRPGSDNPVVLTIFEGLLSRFPDRTLVAETKSPWKLRLYRLR
ncbi:glycosyltransferase family 39 protein [candidate division WOR-3 bacterium]|uniref:Glycosyltransferase family 39 protein n=1 Tax=candidate division WOR-3 bacterium TaxID=2052148 RepID=A0A937XF06_UNCW3|nr:glycosyltransferase family 39 protein [candidate division WOR-3 bacterium]